MWKGIAGRANDWDEEKRLFQEHGWKYRLMEGGSTVSCTEHICELARMAGSSQNLLEHKSDQLQQTGRRQIVCKYGILFLPFS